MSLPQPVSKIKLVILYHTLVGKSKLSFCFSSFTAILETMNMKFQQQLSSQGADKVAVLKT